MKIRVTVTFEYEDNSAETITEEIAVLHRQMTTEDTFGLTLAEGKNILSTLQTQMLTHQIAASSRQFQQCEHCEKPRRRNGRDVVTYRTLFGNCQLTSQRFYHCDCSKHETKTFSSLAVLIPERTAPEFAYLQSKWASLMSYGQTVKLLEDVLPLDANTSSAHRQTLATAERMEDDLGEEQACYIEGTVDDWVELPPPDDRLFVGIDGGFVRNYDAGSRATSHFEIIVGKTQEAEKESKRFAFVQTWDDKPKRRVAETLQAHGMQMNQHVTFLTDGADDVRQIPANLNPSSEHILDYFHVTMKLTVLRQIAKGIAVKTQLAEALAAIDRIKHRLWHGQVKKALKAIAELQDDCELSEGTDARFGRLGNMLAEFGKYIKNNADFIPNYAERHRYGELISTSFVESAVNEIVSKRMVKKQQMRWSKRGAHLLLQVRMKTLNDELRNKFESWYPSLVATPDLSSNSRLSC